MIWPSLLAPYVILYEDIGQVDPVKVRIEMGLHRTLPPWCLPRYSTHVPDGPHDRIGTNPPEPKSSRNDELKTADHGS